MADGVILLHGILRTHRSMGGFARFLTQQGFATLNLGYPSTRQDLQALVEHIHPQVKAFSETLTGRVHFVGYSMGGLVIRAYLAKYSPQNLGRVVMVGTPNGGSEVADFLKDARLYKLFYGPAGQQLITNQSGFSHIFGTVNYELGVIVGNKTIDPISSRIIGKPSDGKVSIESALIDGRSDDVLVACSHTFFPNSKTAWRQTDAFLRNGKFTKQ